MLPNSQRRGPSLRTVLPCKFASLKGAATYTAGHGAATGTDVPLWRGDSAVTPNLQTLRDLRERIPSFSCMAGCHDCCGPVTASSEEMSRLPVKTDAEHDAALAALSCPHLGEHGCQVYGERPLICRLFGTTPRLACPRGQRPEQMIDAKTEHDIHNFLVLTRQVLV